MLLQLVLAMIPIFYLLVFKLLMEIGKRLEAVMRQFFWKGYGPGQNHRLLMVSRDVV